jgi:hypothetical protein
MIYEKENLLCSRNDVALIAGGEMVQVSDKAFLRKSFGALLSTATTPSATPIGRFERFARSGNSRGTNQSMATR